MCCGKTTCKRPKNLQSKPEACPPEQVRKCHEDVRKHPCATGSDRGHKSQSPDMNRRARS